MAWGSASNQAVTCLQDVMSLGAEARMNFPSTQSGNWQWRYTSDMLTDARKARLRELTEIFERVAPKPKEAEQVAVSL